MGVIVRELNYKDKLFRHLTIIISVSRFFPSPKILVIAHPFMLRNIHKTAPKGRFKYREELL